MLVVTCCHLGGGEASPTTSSTFAQPRSASFKNGRDICTATAWRSTVIHQFHEQPFTSKASSRWLNMMIEKTSAVGIPSC